MQKGQLILQLTILRSLTHEVLGQELMGCFAKDLLNGVQEGLKNVILDSQILELDQIVLG